MNLRFSVFLLSSFLGARGSWAQSPAPPAAQSPVQEALPAAPPPVPTAIGPAEAAPGGSPVPATGAVAAPPASRSPAVTASAPSVDDPDRNGSKDFVLELHTTGFLGSLRNGIFLGGGSHRFTAGAFVDVFRAAIGSQSEVGFGVGPGLRWSLATTDDQRVDLILSTDLRFNKTNVTDNQGFVLPDGYEVVFDMGPGLRLWLTKHLAINYSGLLILDFARSRNQQVQVFSDYQRRNDLQPTMRAPSATWTYFSGRLALAGYF
ncbi:MAG TPA: hypothetical protein VFH73_12380 [Polyangia bacterium]|jgi:hypothetical protein|nr:hypothetical protein [Polyangia bacterium]